jgi:uncharacterized protein (TIGR02001 family)
VTHKLKIILITLFACITSISFAQDLSLSVGADFVNRYIWRGLNVNDAFNIQPSVSLAVSGFSFGLWGSYAVPADSNNYTYSQEIDTYIGYNYAFENGMSAGVIITDYYYPNAGIKWGDFNNYDNPAGPGAHTIETGILLFGPKSFPLSLAGYVNVYDDAGHNTYFQIDYPVTVVEVGLNFFIGAAGGSADNPGYYGVESFNVINLGVKATKSIKITEDYSLPVFVTFCMNPNKEITYLVFGMTL